jgi:hypothetical protein
MATKATQTILFCIKTRRGGFLVRHQRNLTYKKALQVVAALKKQGFLAIMERQ